MFLLPTGPSLQYRICGVFSDFRLTALRELHPIRFHFYVRRVVMAPPTSAAASKAVARHESVERARGRGTTPSAVNPGKAVGGNVKDNEVSKACQTWCWIGGLMIYDSYLLH